MKRTAYLVMVAITLGYLILGAVVFHFMEKQHEKNTKHKFALEHEIFLMNHSCISPDALRKYVQQVLETSGEGVSIYQIIDMNVTANSSIVDDLDATGTRWDIPSAILFCITLISTIGYGNMAPKTYSGRLFCIFYAIIGIPMFAAVLVGTGERLQKPIKVIHNYRPWIKNNPSRDEQLKSIVFLLIGVCIIVFIPSLTFMYTESWSYLQAVYYTIITLTTIGFGDFVPGYFDKPAKFGAKTHNAFRICLGLWILLGLAWGALILSEIGSMLQTRITTAANQTQNKLSHLEGIVKKKAQATKAKIIKRDKEKDELTGKETNGSVDVDIKVTDSSDGEDRDEYNPTNSDMELNA
ncbi:potassium channel subfamily K member 4 [Biomphalaria pfeifferi]|uniref:Potassium channel subfamily K member 4 n=1 Tax=Biomphalaria pfeifferi TaxID=112525 RepID=A0AAD8F6L3_BIOPF|nr:potassium channel subfamily K member 4 [Biomphalaria pfeifferi]